MAADLPGHGSVGIDPDAGIPVLPPVRQTELGQSVDHHLLDGVDVAGYGRRWPMGTLTIG